MKSSLIAICFLVLSFLPNPLLGAPRPLYDSSGREVVTGTQYNIYTIFVEGDSAGFRGLDLCRGKNNPCPLDVFLRGKNLQFGSPALLFPAYYTGVNGTVVYESTDLNIQFDVRPPDCNQHSTVWRVDNYNDKEGAWFITTDGVIGNPGPQTLRNWFKFEKASESVSLYNIVHCPSVCESCVKLCSNVSFHTETRLALSQSPYFIGFAFLKVSDVQEHRGSFNAEVLRSIDHTSRHGLMT